MKHLFRHFSFSSLLLLSAASFFGCSAQSQNLTNVVQTENPKPSLTPLPLPSNPQSKTTLIEEIDLRINDIGLGISESKILQRLGKPLQNKKGEFNECGYGFEKTFRYSGLGIELLGNDKGRNFTVIAMEVTSPKWLVSGIRVGADAKDVLAKFGEPLEKRTESGVESWSYVNKGNDGFAGFYFRDNKLVKILWESAIC